MINLQVEITGLTEALSSLEKIKRIVTTFDPELQEVSDYLINFLINDVFESEGSVYGAPWSPLTTRYALQKLRKYGATNILIATGKMRASWRGYTASDYLIVQNEATNENGDYYAGYHQEGTYKMAQRILLMFDEERQNAIRDIIVNSLNSRIEGSL